MIKNTSLFFLILLLSFSGNLLAQYGSTSPTLQDDFGKKNGHLRFSKTTLNIGDIKNNEVRVDTIFIYNSGSSAITMALINKPPTYLQTILSAGLVGASQKAYLIIKYDATKRNDFGFVLDRIQINTNDTDQPQKYITVSGQMHEYFPQEIIDDTVKMNLDFSELSFNYGSLKQGDKATHDFKIFNHGPKNVLLHKVKTTCGCLKAQLSKRELPAGDSATVHVEFDSFGKEGSDSRSLSVYMNDPEHPEMKLEMKGEIRK